MKKTTAKVSVGTVGLGGHIRFTNGVECFSSYTGPDYLGIEVVGTHGVIRNINNTGVGLRMFRTDNPKDNPELLEVDGTFLPTAPSPRERDEEGWRKPSQVMMATITAVAEAIDTGDPLEVTTGDDLRHSLEIAIAIRESARQDGKAVRLPIQDRGIMMYPEVWRWHYKKEVYGEEWYREQMTEHVKPGEKYG